MSMTGRNEKRETSSALPAADVDSDVDADEDAVDAIFVVCYCDSCDLTIDGRIKVCLGGTNLLLYRPMLFKPSK